MYNIVSWTYLHIRPYNGSWVCFNINNNIIQTYTATSRKVVGKSARDYPERYFGWFCVHLSSSRKFERVAPEAMDVCLRVLKKSSKSRFDNYSVRNSVLIISHNIY